MNSKNIILIFSLVIAGCNKSNDPVKSNCLITQDLITDAFGTDLLTFTYVDNRVISILDSYTRDGSTTNITLTFSYDGVGNISSVEFSDGFRIVNTYDNLSRRIGRDDYQGLDWIERREYLYNGSNQLIKLQYYSVSSGVANKSNFNTFVYLSTSTKNYSRQNLYDSGGTLSGSLEFEYDNKRNSFPNLGLGIRIDNNQTKVSIKDANGSITGTTASSYQYNSQGYPIKITTVSNTGQTQTYSSHEVITYNCQ